LGNNFNQEIFPIFAQTRFTMPSPGRKPTVSDKEILSVFALSPDPAFFASELTDELGLSRQGVLSRLDELDERGLLDSKKASGRRIFWITTDGRRYVRDAGSSDEDSSVRQ
jgi:predicted ArsR family transcriptional regulator